MASFDNQAFSTAAFDASSFDISEAYEVRVSWVQFDAAVVQIKVAHGGSSGATPDRSAIISRQRQYRERERIKQQNQVILSLVINAVTQGLL